jgi:hypothetical protein
VARYADWDAAIERRSPLTLKFMGEEWHVGGFDFRDFAVVAEVIDNPKSDKATCDTILEFLAANSQDPDRFRVLAAEYKPVQLSMLLAVVRWVIQEDVGTPWEPGDGADADPLAAPPASSKSAGGNGRSSVGGSRKSASKTR